MAVSKMSGKLPRSTATSQGPKPQNPAASMALIFDAMQHPLDPLYEDVARARAAEGKPPAGHSSALTILTATLIGLLLAIGGHALRVPAKVVQDRHAQLVKDIAAAEKVNDAKTREIAGLRSDVAAEANGVLGRSSSKGLKDAIAQGSLNAGLAPMPGSGMTVTLANPSGNNAGSSDSDPRTNASTNAVTSSDLQQITNALWRAGARGIAINDQRITSLTAIRFAGSAVLVNFRPLTSPYTVSVIGPSSIKEDFDGGFGGQYLKGMSNSGISIHESSSSNLTLPAASVAQIQHASPAN